MESIAEGYPEFTNLAEYRRELSERNFDSLLKTGAQDWYSPSGFYEIKSTDTVRDPKVVHKCFQTPNIEAAFLTTLKQTGIQADTISIQKQFHYIAANENAFRRRHATVPKMLANRMYIKEIADSGAESDLIQYVVQHYMEVGKQQLDDKQEKKA